MSENLSKDVKRKPFNFGPCSAFTNTVDRLEAIRKAALEGRQWPKTQTKNKKQTSHLKTTATASKT